MKQEKPIIEYDPYGHTGNIFWILGEVNKIMRKQRRIIAYNELRDRVFEAQSYEDFSLSGLMLPAGSVRT